MKKHEPFSLAGATEIRRKDLAAIRPPEMFSIENMYLAASDATPTLRGDLARETEALLAWSENVIWGGSDDDEDYMCAIVRAQTNGPKVYLSKLMPFTSASSVTTKKVKTYDTGTVAGSLGGTTVTGTGTKWLKNAWPGCWIEMDSDSTVYLITAVASDTSLTVSGDLDDTYAAETYTIYQTHHPDNALWPFNVQRHVDALIYNAVDPRSPIDPDKICGPFYSRVGDAFATYTGTQETTNTLTYYLTRNGDTIVASAPGVVGDTTDISVDGGDTWTVGTDSINLGGGSQGVTWTGGKYWATGNLTYYSTNGSTFTETSADPGTGTGIASNGSRVVVISSSDFYYSDNDGDSWTTVEVTGVNWKRIFYTGQVFIAQSHTSGGGRVAVSADGASWLEYTLGSMTWADMAVGDDTVIFVGQNGVIWTCNLDGTGFQEQDSGTTSNLLGASWSGQRFLVGVPGSSNQINMLQSYDGVDWFDFTASITGTYSPDSIAETSQGVVFTYTTSNAVVRISGSPATRSVDVDEFKRISSVYRGKSFAVQGTQVCLYGTLEYVDGAWAYHPRRMRWSVPGTANNFGGEYSGFLDFPGEGAFLDSRPVGNNAIIAEANQIGFVYDLGRADNPWGYKVIKHEHWALSNLCNYDKLVFWIGKDGLLYSANASGNVQQVGDFDLTKFDDFDGTQPVQLSVSSDHNCLTVFVPGLSDEIFMITEAGQVSHFSLPTLTNGAGTIEPNMVFGAKDSEEPRLYVSYGPLNADTDHIVTAYFETGAAVTGIDELTAAQTFRWYALLETGEFRVTPEGLRGILHELMLRYYNDSADDYAPHVFHEMMSTEESTWRSPGDDAAGTITAGTSALTGSGTAFVKDTDQIGGTLIAAGDDASTEFDLPCLATQARVYLETGGVYTATTAFTITDTKQITLTSVLVSGTNLWVYWDAMPIPMGAAGDFILSDEGAHRISAITTAEAGTLNWYPTAQDATVDFRPAQQTENGHGFVISGMGLKFDGIRIRTYIVPNGHASAGDLFKATELSVIYSPSGPEVKNDGV